MNPVWSSLLYNLCSLSCFSVKLTENDVNCVIQKKAALKQERSDCSQDTTALSDINARYDTRPDNNGWRADKD